MQKETKELKANVGGIDSFIRIFCGVWLVYAALHSYIGNWGFLGAILMATGMGRIDPLYLALGFSTNHQVEHPAAH